MRNPPVENPTLSIPMSSYGQSKFYCKKPSNPIFVSLRFKPALPETPAPELGDTIELQLDGERRLTCRGSWPDSNSFAIICI